MEFIGVSTGGSFIRRLFPAWARDLDLGDAVLEGRDLPLDAGPQAYRDAVRRIRDDPNTVGALVTTHKLAVLESAGDLFDELDPYAELLHEVSGISKRDGRLIGHAKDPITAGAALDAVLAPGHFARTGAHVLCLGAGGAGTAIVLHLLSGGGAAGRPARIVAVDTQAARLGELSALAARAGAGPALELVEGGDPRADDALVAALPPGSLVVNATGMGKDRPGSPVTDAVRFPRAGVAWELNYRGELGFLHQARAQAAELGLTVEDGWLYFLHGWSAVIAEVFGLELTPERFARLRATAEALR
jgi:shikimate 5-dehydrogenase